MDECSARPAGSADLSELADLVRSCVTDLREQRGGHLWSITDARVEPVESSLLDDIADPSVLVLCGTYDGVTVGIAVARMQPTTDGRSLARVSDLFTDPQARHVGVGEAMMNECVAWARERDAIAIDAAVLPGTRDAKNFFEGFGLTARALTVSLRLKD